MRGIEEYVRKELKKEKMNEKQKKKNYKKIKKSKEKKIKIDLKDVVYMTVIFVVLLTLPIVSQKFTDEREEKIKPMERMYDSFKDLTDEEGGK